MARIFIKSLLSVEIVSTERSSLLVVERNIALRTWASKHENNAARPSCLGGFYVA